MAEQDGGFAAQDPFEAFRRLWGPLGLPVPGMAMPTLDPAELEKRIADLRSVETWLGMNLNMVKMAIQGLEVQRMALDAMKTNAGAAGDAANAFADFSRTMAGAAGSAGGSGGAAAANPLLWPWAMMQGATGAPAAGKPAAEEDAPGPKTKESGSK
jgi:hypothetical protein